MIQNWEVRAAEDRQTSDTDLKKGGGGGLYASDERDGAAADRLTRSGDSVVANT